MLQGVGESLRVPLCETENVRETQLEALFVEDVLHVPEEEVDRVSVTDNEMLEESERSDEAEALSVFESE